MNRKLFFTAFLMLLCSTMFGQWNWTAPAPNEFEHSMNVGAIIKINGVSDARENLELAAFCDGAVRGTTKTQKTTINNEEVAFAFITIYGNHDYEDIKFKLYVPSTNGTDEGKVLVTDYIVSFKSGSLIGNITPEVIDFYESHWHCDVVFNNTMTVGCTINIDGVPYNGTDVEIAAFCNGEVRGVGRPVYWEETGQYYTELIVGKLVVEENQGVGNEDNDIISFKLYHPEYGELNTDYTVQFKDGETIVDENNMAISIDFLNEAEAQIKRNGVYRYFTTLKEAVKGAVEGETIELLKDITATEVILIDKSLTINGSKTETENYTVTSSATRVFRVTTGNTEVTLNKVNMVSTAERVGTNDVRGISIDNVENVKLTLNNCSVDFEHASANDWAYAVNVTGGKDHVVTVIGGTYEGANVINVRGANNTVTVKDAVITSTYPNNDLYYGACIWVLKNQGSSVEATGNTFNGINAIAFNLGTGNTLTESNNIDNTKYVVAKIGNEYYTSLVDAFAAVKNGETIKVLQNISLAETVKVNNQITLDLNGKTITGTDNATASFALIEIQPGKELTVEGNNGTITLTATNNRQFNAFSSVISNQRGKLVVNNATIEHLGGTDMAYAIDNLTNTGSQIAETVINSGTIKSPYRAIRQFLNSSAQGVNNILTVNGGTIEGANKSIWMQDANANANPGKLTVSENASLKGDVYLSVTAGSTEWPVEVSVATVALKNDSKVLTNNNELECYDIKIKDGAWVVYFGVAKIGDTLYETLAEALSAAANNATVKLLWKEGDAPIAMNGTVVGNKTVTITGKANVDWNKGWFFVGRGGEGDGKVIFDNAMLTSVSNSNTYGFNVSGSKKNDNNTNDGVIEIKNSTIVLDYMLNKGTMSLDKSTLTVKNGFSVTGRLANESATGVDATATMTLSNESKLVVNNINGMGVGHEAYGVMNIDASSIFEATQNFLVASKGTMNIAGNAIVAEGKTLTNNGTIVLTDLNATLTSNECGNVTTNVADHVVAYINGTYTLNDAVAKIGETPYATLQKAVNAVKNGETIVLLSDITENVTLTEKVGLYYTIDGASKTMNGNIKITALSETNDDRRITIKNINFKDETAAEVGFIQSEETNHYPCITVEGCTFTGSGDATDVAVRLKSSHSVVIKGCTGTGLHSFLQNTSGWNLTIEGVKVTDSKSGLALGTVQGVTVKDCEITVAGYGIRMDANTYNNNAVIESNKVEAFIPVVVRKANAESNITFKGTNTMNQTNDDYYWCVIGKTEYEEGVSLENGFELATGKVRVEIVNSENLPQSGLYGNHIEGTHSAAYVGTDGYWGECGGWANYSFELKFYNGDTFMGSTSLNDVENIIDGDVNVTWNMKLDATSNTDEYWTMAWTVAPTIANQPNRVEQWVDGVKVAESAIQLNGPDGLNPIVAAVVAGEDRVIKSFATTLSNAVSAAEGNTVVLFRDINETLTVVKPTNNIIIDGNGKTVEGGMSFGSDDNKLDNYSISVSNVNFVGKGISVKELNSVAISENTFTGITEGNAITVVCDGLTETVNVKDNVIENVEKGHAVRIRNAKAVVVDGNNIDGVFNSAILLEGTTYGDVAVTNNVLTDWGKDIAGKGRAIRIVKGEGTTATITGNAMMHENAPEEFVKVSSNTENVNINENYWNGSNPDETAGLYDVLNVYPENYYSEYENGELKNLVTLSYVAQIGAAKYTTLQKAVNAVQEDATITFLSDIVENVTVDQNNGIDIVIDGKEYKFSGTITIDGNSRTDGESLTIQNINFVTDVEGLYFIEQNSAESEVRYPHNVTVQKCTFTAVESTPAVNTAVAMRFRQGFNITVKEVEAVRLHSLMQNYGVAGVTVKDVKVDGKNGISLGTSTDVTIQDANITALGGYGLRFDAETTTSAVVTDCEINAFIPVVVRYATKDYNITFNGDNTMAQTNTDGYWCVIGTSEYEVDGLLPTAATGKVIVTLNDDDLSMTGVYGNYYEATIDGTQYIALKDAFDAAENGDEIVVARDINIEETINVAAGQNIILNLNGCTVSMTDSSNAASAMIKNNGNLTIKGEIENSKLSFATTTPSAANAYASNTISNYGTITVLSGIIENTSVGGGACYAIDNYAGSTATIVGGKLIAEKTTLRIFNWTDGDAAKATLNIQGGEIVSNDGYGVNLNLGNSPYVDLNITGGTITTNDTDYNLAVYVVNKNSAENVNINVEGGIFNGNFALNGLTATTMVEGKVSISGGTFEGVICYDTPAYGFITGGTFTMDVNEYCAEYYTAIYDPATARYNVVLSGGVQTREFVEGWSWFSTYIDSETLLQDLKDELNPNGIQIKGQDGYTQFYSGYGENGAWSPGLTSVSTTKMYMIKTKAAVEVELEGNFVEENREITLNSGWNWIGYPVRERVFVKDAIRNIIPTHGDMIKSQTQSLAYSTYFGGWIGDNFAMNPGEGYMYYSYAGQSFEFTYSKETSASSRTLAEPVEYHWIANSSQYPSNMTVIAMLNIDGEVAADNYEVAAFANGECRGSARPIYVEAIDSYILIMTIQGEEVEELTFKCYDVNYGAEYELSNRFNYSSDAILGSFEEPYMFNMNFLNIEESTLDMINIYPNPTTTDRAINLQATCDNVEVFNALGVKVAEYQNVDTIDALETAGVYVIRVTINGEVKNCRLVVK